MGAAAPVEEAAAPVEEVAAPVEDVAAPVEEAAAPVEEVSAPVEEIVVESTSSDSEQETVSQEIFSLTEVSQKKEEIIKEPSAEEIMAFKEAKEESVTPALA